MKQSPLKVASVAFPIAVPGVYDYEIPEIFHDHIIPGAPVFVELKNRKLWGVAIALKEKSSFPHLKRILDIKINSWTDQDKSLIRLYEWVAAYYQSDIGALFKPFMKKRLVESTAKTISVYTVPKPPAENPKENLTLRQCRAYENLLQVLNDASPMPLSKLTELHGVSPHMLKILVSKGFIRKEEKTVVREADELGIETLPVSLDLSPEQKSAVENMELEREAGNRPCLLYGITGSGKTYVYIELVRRTLALGKGVIILVPEISLTPQTIRRFKEALGPVMTVIHSRMSDGERRDSLEELVTGKKRMVIGVRSAIFAPIENTGLIIVDEEHDGSYKQSDIEPRYHARDVAVMRGRMQNALVVLGSATPSFESYQNALIGKYLLAPLTQRYGEARLPLVEIVDMGQEHRDNNWAVLSRLLHRRITETLASGRQIILLLNRRGFSTVLICKNCGHTYTCPNCSVSLTYHKEGLDLKCHQCGYFEPAPDKCPKCQGDQIKFKGTGIQKAEEYLREQFPESRIIRMDQDTTRFKGAHVEILERFARLEADILLGTQMVAKGLNFPGVALVGILQADIGLHFPDFRATEKTFQLLAQAAGRAGREDSLGEVIIQTYFPNEPGIVSAKTHDYLEFFKQESCHRENLRYPPFGKLLRIIVTGKHEPAVMAAIGTIALTIKNRAYENVTVLGPSPAIFSRINNLFRYCILLKAPAAQTLQKIAGSIKNGTKPASGIKVIIDVDPLNML
jgi:primosomal protein N' (replication factor Y) (superfamily II helicase)